MYHQLCDIINAGSEQVCLLRALLCQSEPQTEGVEGMHVSHSPLFLMLLSWTLAVYSLATHLCQDFLPPSLYVIAKVYEKYKPPYF